METYPFDAPTHILSPPLDHESRAKIAEFREALATEDLYIQYRNYCSDSQLQRFLIARQYNVKASVQLLLSALQWRSTRIPAVGGIESLPGWEAKMSKESETGKIYLPGFDRYDRPVIVFDNSVQNTKSIDDQLIFLSWNLEMACRLMDSSKVDKYVVFMNLEIFSVFDSPPMKATKETIFMLCSGFPERLGHCIAYMPPSFFKVVFNSVKGLIDPRTAAKMVFVTGDVSDGSANDLNMKSIIGDNWKVLTGAEQAVVKQGNSRGYDHSTYWPFAMKRLQDLMAKESASRMSSQGVDNEQEERKEDEGTMKEIPVHQQQQQQQQQLQGSGSGVAEQQAQMREDIMDEDDSGSMESGFSGVSGLGLYGVRQWESNRLACALCRQTFGVVIRRHHCRLCGKCVCYKCSPHRKSLPLSAATALSSRASIVQPAPSSSARGSTTLHDISSSDSKRLHRVCVVCVSSLEAINEQQYPATSVVQDTVSSLTNPTVTRSVKRHVATVEKSLFGSIGDDDDDNDEEEEKVEGVPVGNSLTGSRSAQTTCSVPPLTSESMYVKMHCSILGVDELDGQCWLEVRVAFHSETSSLLQFFTERCEGAGGTGDRGDKLSLVGSHSELFRFHALHAPRSELTCTYSVLEMKRVSSGTGTTTTVMGVQTMSLCSTYGHQGIAPWNKLTLDLSAVCCDPVRVRLIPWDSAVGLVDTLSSLSSPSSSSVSWGQSASSATMALESKSKASKKWDITSQLNQAKHQSGGGGQQGVDLTVRLHQKTSTSHDKLWLIGFIAGVLALIGGTYVDKEFTRQQLERSAVLGLMMNNWRPIRSSKSFADYALYGYWAIFAGLILLYVWGNIL